MVNDRLIKDRRYVCARVPRPVRADDAQHAFPGQADEAGQLEIAQLSILMGPEVRHGEAEVHTRVQA